MARLLIIFSFIMNSMMMPSAFGSPRMVGKLSYVKSVELSQPRQSLQAKGVRLSYARACGESFRGVLLTPAKGSVRVGVVVDRSDKYCSALPVREELYLPWMNLNKISLFNRRAMSRVVLVEALDVAVSNNAMTVSWQDSCVPILGVLVSSVITGGEARMGINMAVGPQDLVSKETQGACAREVRRIDIEGVQIPSDQIQLNIRPGQITDLYALRINAPSKVSVSQEGILTLEWTKNCREKPVGIVFTGTGGLDVAIISAVAFNSKCESGGGKLRDQVAAFTLRGMVIAPGKKVVGLTKLKAFSMTKDAQFDVSLQPVSSLKLARRGSGDRLLAASTLTCSRRLGLVAGHDSIGNFAIAALSEGGKKICPVVQSINASEISAPLVGPMTGPMPKVFSLKVFGTSIN